MNNKIVIQLIMGTIVLTLVIWSLIIGAVVSTFKYGISVFKK